MFHWWKFQIHLLFIKAIIQWQQAIELVNDADKLEAEGELDKAIQKYKAAIALYPDDPQFYAALGLCLTTRKSYGDQSEAINSFKHALTLDGNNWRLWNDLGSLLYEGDTEQANEEDNNKQFAEAKHAFQMACYRNSKDLTPAQRQALLGCISSTNSVSSLSKQFKIIR